ncbi:ATP-binding protein [Actinocrinis puniceicyclus]|uniref:ATP-binding protein n=1 Tax=Actinocrinis puniceicyclus TaxID=977794 RepID=A0A8J8BCM4_9ACTN|nr:ATP-binding protein [Actinocrinis puniceicyclus]MBS2961929.1 ATP-binding protein [Actinocrinis puniceicyclus]
MTSVDLALALGTVETATLEFKVAAKSASTREKIGQAICAMANDLTAAGGGDILVGVDDNGNPADDVDTSDGALRAFADFRDDGRILDRPGLTVNIATYKTKPVVRLHVNASAAPPVRFNNVVYVRPGPTTRKAHADDERVLTERRRANDLPFDLHTRPSAAQDDLNLKDRTGGSLPIISTASTITAIRHSPGR